MKTEHAARSTATLRGRRIRAGLMVSTALATAIAVAALAQVGGAAPAAAPGCMTPGLVVWLTRWATEPREASTTRSSSRISRTRMLPQRLPLHPWGEPCRRDARQCRLVRSQSCSGFGHDCKRRHRESRAAHRRGRQLPALDLPPGHRGGASGLPAQPDPRGDRPVPLRCLLAYGSRLPRGRPRDEKLGAAPVRPAGGAVLTAPPRVLAALR